VEVGRTWDERDVAVVVLREGNAGGERVNVLVKSAMIWSG
jgi:hypothetical protein